MTTFQQLVIAWTEGKVSDDKFVKEYRRLSVPQIPDTPVLFHEASSIEAVAQMQADAIISGAEARRILELIAFSVKR
jgi:hypothetical protein